MSKMQKSSSAPGTKPAPARKFHDRDLKSVNPLKQQFEPTEAQAVRQHKRMAGEA